MKHLLTETAAIPSCAEVAEYTHRLYSFEKTLGKSLPCHTKEGFKDVD
jgi:hypothetical protein